LENAKREEEPLRGKEEEEGGGSPGGGEEERRGEESKNCSHLHIKLLSEWGIFATMRSIRSSANGSFYEL